MPAQGPSKIMAYKRGDEIADYVIKMMNEKHRICRPELHPGDPKGFIGRMQADWDTHEKKLRAAIKELVWDYECANW